MSIKQTFYKLINKIMFKQNNVLYDSFIINGIIKVTNKHIIKIGKNFVANSGKNANPIGGDTILRLITGKKGTLRIKDNVGISNSTIICWDKIEIGNYVSIGGGCKIWDTDFHSINPVLRRHTGGNHIKTAPIIIGDYAFIGGDVLILKGVNIGKNSVVAAGSVVTKSIPSNEVWGGNPAKFLKKNNYIIDCE